MRQVNKATSEPLDRPPEPVLGKPSYFVAHVAPRIEGMQGLTDSDNITKLLNGKYRGKNYDGWVAVPKGEIGENYARSLLASRAQAGARTKGAGL